MTAINIFPYRPTASTAAGTTTIEHDFTVPAGKRWLIDYVEVEFGTQAANNTVDIQTNASGSYLNIWEQLASFKKLGVDLAARYPRAVELEAGDVLRCHYVRGTSSTIASALHIMERDV